MALEPESGLAWYDAGRKDLNLVIGVQSPSEITTAIAYLLGNAQAAFKPAHISANCASCGGGFGGRDHTPFPLYVALAGMFFPNRPVRLANNRFEQFQLGIKRHAFKMRTQIGVDRATGKIVGFAADHALDGGGLANFSGQVASVGALAALGIYYVPKVDLTTYAFHSRGVTAGSMRCYGTIQTMTALEVQVDEICTALPLDPIEFRRRNALAAGNRTWRGTPTSCRSARPKSWISWRSIRSGRSAPKRRRADSSREFSSVPASRVATKNYGTGGDASPGIRRNRARRPDRHLLRRRSRWATVSERRWPIGSQRIWVAFADEVALAQVDTFGPLDLVTSGDPFTIDQKTQDAAARNPRWVPAISSATAASTGAHVGTHPAAEAARVIFRFGLWPAALELWGIAPKDPKAKDWEKARWKDGQLVMPGLSAASLAGSRRKGACAQRRDRRDGARLQPLGLVARDLRGRRTAVDGRHRCAGRAPRHGQICSHRSFQREVSASQPQPERTDLHGAVRHAGPHRDRPRNRRVTYRKSIQRVGMRPGVGSRDRAGTGAGRLRNGRWLCVARERCRFTRTGPATGNGTSVNTSSRAARTCRCNGLEIEMLPPVDAANRRRAWPKS